MQPGDVISECYQLVRQIGVGGMSEVWEATSGMTGSQVALKFLRHEMAVDTTAITRFLREAVAATLAQTSSHFVRVYGHGGPLPDGSYYLAMEYIEGESLRDVLLREGPLLPARAADLVVQACHALAEVHGQGIVHRDVKPENLMVSADEDGREHVRLVDFGIAKFRNSPDDVTRSLAVKGEVAGTPIYLAPERLAAAAAESFTPATLIAALNELDAERDGDQG
jgi:eukaryotic-like serine/threonine-protein kinase